MAELDTPQPEIRACCLLTPIEQSVVLAMMQMVNTEDIKPTIAGKGAGYNKAQRKRAYHRAFSKIANASMVDLNCGLHPRRKGRP